MKLRIPDQPPKRLLQISAIPLLLIALAALFFAHRNARLQELTREATSPFAFDSNAVEQLGNYKGEQAVNALLEVATSHTFENNRILAIRELGTRGDDEVAITLANILQPHEGFAIRKVVGEELVRRHCPAACIAIVLRYEDRIFDGERTVEATFFSDPDTGHRLKAEEAEFVANLDKVLAKEPGLTIRELVDTYGLGSWPSRFALNVTTRLKLTDACPALQNSSRLLAGPMLSGETELRSELADSMRQLQCGASNQ